MTDREKMIEHLKKIAEYFRWCRTNASFSSKAENHFWELQNTASEAAELLKAQEPRVMTLEEAKNSEFCFCESGSVFACHMFVDPADGFATIQQFGRPDILIDSNEYGISFRCWTSRPTDEQREKVKWE
jgi:hypothetical protein